MSAVWKDQLGDEMTVLIMVVLKDLRGAAVKAALTDARTVLLKVG